MNDSWRSIVWTGVWTGALLSGLGLISGCALYQDARSAAESSPLEAAQAATPMPPAPTYRRIEQARATLHVVTVADPQAYPVGVAIADGLSPTETQTAAQGAIAAINAGFFDPNNGQTTSFGVVAGELVADPRQNQRLVGNPDLTRYLDQILNRSEFRRYDCGDGRRYDITVHSAPTPADCRLEAAIGAGPQLLPEDTAYAEAFIDYGRDGAINRDALGSRYPNARSAMGLTADGAIVLVMAAQRPGESPSGLTLGEMASFLEGLGVEKALNLDGGSSASLVFAGNTYYGRLDQEGNPVHRSVKSILWVKDPVEPGPTVSH